MHEKYRQDNLHRMTWYIGTCGIMAMGLLYMLADCTKIKYTQVYESYAVKCAYKCEVDPQGNCVVKIIFFYLNKSYFNLVSQLVVQI